MEKCSTRGTIRLWDMANELRGNMSANEFKDYILNNFL